MSGVVLRKIMPDDNARIAEIIREGMTEFGLNKAGSGFDDPEMADLCAAYSRPGCAYFVALDGNELLGGGGYALLRQSDGKTCELQRMYLTPAARGKGVGKQLLAQCLTSAGAAGYETCYLETETTMDTAQALYRRFGFQKQDSRSGNTGHCACNTFYTKNLNA